MKKPRRWAGGDSCFRYATRDQNRPLKTGKSLAADGAIPLLRVQGFDAAVVVVVTGDRLDIQGAAMLQSSHHRVTNLLARFGPWQFEMAAQALSDPVILRVKECEHPFAALFRNDDHLHLLDPRIQAVAVQHKEVVITDGASQGNGSAGHGDVGGRDKHDGADQKFGSHLYSLSENSD